MKALTSRAPPGLWQAGCEDAGLRDQLHKLPVSWWEAVVRVSWEVAMAVAQVWRHIRSNNAPACRVFGSRDGSRLVPMVVEQ